MKIRKSLEGYKKLNFRKTGNLKILKKKMKIRKSLEGYKKVKF
jgi:hypothetical protein